MKEKKTILQEIEKERTSKITEYTIKDKVIQSYQEMMLSWVAQNERRVSL